MGLWEQFPYANFHEINIDWLMRLVKDLNERVKALEDVDIRVLIEQELHIMIEDGTFEELFDDMLDSIRAAIAELTSLVETNTDDIADLNTSQLEQDTLIYNLRTDMTQAQTDIEALRAAIQILDPTGEIGDIAQTIAEIQQALSALQITVNNHTTQIANHESRITALENGGAVPFVDQYDSRDLSNDMTFPEFCNNIRARNGVVKLGNYILVNYTDPDTSTVATATCVCADENCIIIRNTKHVKFGMPSATGSGYYNSTVKT